MARLKSCPFAQLTHESASKSAGKRTPVLDVTSNSMDAAGKYVRNGGAIRLGHFSALCGGNVKNAGKMKVLGGLAILGAGLLLNGCKHVPDFTAANAQALIQADYDSKQAAGALIKIDDRGLRQGLTANYWKLTKVYPNKMWADYTLTDDGKKVLTLQGGGDVIQWRPDQIASASPHFYVVTMAAKPFNAKDVQDPQDEVLPGVATAKSAVFNESVDLTGVPAALSEIAHNPGNTLSSKKTANFELANGAWKLHSIE